MLEPDVTLTDYALALECAVFTVLLLRQRGAADPLRAWWAFFFATVGLAALIGGTVHGFFPGHSGLWLATMLTLGATSLAAWFVGSLLLGMRWLRPVAVVLLGLYAGVVVFVIRDFVVAIAMYLPATVFLLLAMATRYATNRARPEGIGVAGLLLTFVAAAVQQLRIGVHPVYFNHNALYHVIQFVALWMIFVAARHLCVSTTDAATQRARSS